MRAWNLVEAAGWAVQLHLFTVLPAFMIGTWMIFASVKGSPTHRRMGALYMALMLVSATAAMFVRQVNPPHLSWIHLFVPLTYGSVAIALWAVRHGNIEGHRRAMVGLYVGGLLIAGAFTLAPGRLLHRILLG